MGSYTIAESWPLRPAPTDLTPLTMEVDRERREASAEPEDTCSSTLIAAFLDVARRYSPRAVERTAVEDELQSEEPAVRATPRCAPSEQQHEDEAGKTASRRVALLARAYVRGQSAEGDARLAILTERLRELLPPVSEEQWTALGDIAGRLEETASRHQKIRDRLGLK